jgi:Putative Actinobacterial Holin-X, holin superfamily III
METTTSAGATSTPANPPDTKSDPSIGELVGQLSSQTSRLVRDELLLMQRELEKSVKHATIGAGLGGAAGLLGVLGAIALMLAAITALGLVIPLWAAALLVAVLLFAAAGVAALIAKRQVQDVTPAAPRTVESVKDDVREIKEARRA